MLEQFCRYPEEWRGAVSISDYVFLALHLVRYAYKGVKRAVDITVYMDQFRIHAYSFYKFQPRRMRKIVSQFAHGRDEEEGGS